MQPREFHSSKKNKFQPGFVNFIYVAWQRLICRHTCPPMGSGSDRCCLVLQHVCRCRSLSLPHRHAVRPNFDLPYVPGTLERFPARPTSSGSLSDVSPVVAGAVLVVLPACCCSCCQLLPALLRLLAMTLLVAAAVAGLPTAAALLACPTAIAVLYCSTTIGTVDRTSTTSTSTSRWSYRTTNNLESTTWYRYNCSE